jgi:hydroxymethylglutaryl-CoA lyase
VIESALDEATRVRITEVGPRDGLQNEKDIIATADKVRLVDALSRTGVDEIEVSSFVSKRWVPQLGDAAEVFRDIARSSSVIYSALVPNTEGLAGAIAAKTDKIAVFTSASEGFSKKNLNTDIRRSLERVAEVVEEAQFQQLKVRAYVSCVIKCPYDGDTDPEQVAQVVTELRNLGVDEIDLGDTIGAASPELMDRLLEFVGVNTRLTIHLHDTKGQACECVRSCLEHGVRSFDGSVAGLGGCPFAPGAPGNIDTATLVQTVTDAGLETDVNLDALEAAAALAREIVPSCRR